MAVISVRKTSKDGKYNGKWGLFVSGRVKKNLRHEKGNKGSCKVQGQCWRYRSNWESKRRSAKHPRKRGKHTKQRIFRSLV